MFIKQFKFKKQLIKAYNETISKEEEKKGEKNQNGKLFKRNLALGLSLLLYYLK